MHRFQISVVTGFIHIWMACTIADTEHTNYKPLPSANLSTIKCSEKRADDSTSISILFVGNSLTYTNNLPFTVKSIGARHGKLIETEMIAVPNYALEDHWNDGVMQKLICEGSFDFIVVQQGPSSQADGREMLFEYGQRIKDACTSRGTQFAFFMVWPAKINYHTFDSVIKNYSDAASATQSLLCAVGSEFKKLGEKGDYSFYSPDNFHPSEEGTRIAAEIIYRALVK